MSITKIAEVIVGAGGAASIDFTSIPGTYTDLMVVLSLRTNSATVIDEVDLRFNGSSSGYATRYLLGSGTAASSGTNGGGTTEIWSAQTSSANSTANTFGNFSFYIPNYAGSTNKSVSIDAVAENNSSNARVTITAGLWSNTAAITSITMLNVYGSSYVQYSSATLYGVLKGSSGGVTVS